MAQQTIPTWITDEAQKLTQPKQYEELPTLKLVPNQIAEFDVDVSKPFDDWREKDEKGAVLTHKKIIPVVVAGTRMHWWVNVKNPIYREIITAIQNGQTHFKILQTGTKKDTRYNLVK